LRYHFFWTKQTRQRRRQRKTWWDCVRADMESFCLSHEDTVRLSTYGGRTFCYVRPSAWNAVLDFLKTIHFLCLLLDASLNISTSYFLLAHRACSRLLTINTLHKLLTYLLTQDRDKWRLRIKGRNRLTWVYPENGLKTVCACVRVFHSHSSLFQGTLCWLTHECK